MFKLIIADDDVRIREGLSRVVDWGALGFRLAGCYGDGQQVLEHLERDHVDVVLTDIKMNRVSGLEVRGRFRIVFPTPSACWFLPIRNLILRIRQSRWG